MEFAAALATFLVAHSVPAVPRLRGRLVARLGRRAYLVAYSALSLALLAWLIVAARRAGTVALWEPARWQWAVPLALMPVALFLIAAGLFAANPLSVSLRAGAEPGPVTAVTRHPLMWGFLIWALAHIPPNGDLVSVVLFGGMAAFSLAGFALLDAKARRRLGAERWRALSRGTSVVPFAAILAGRARLGPVRPLLPAAAAALAAYAWFLAQGHALLIGPDPLASFRALG
ncbi:NnrUfamily protein [Methylobacterium sp. 4-46]|uniref:NnrU family protein n=1 Tax=unclassified Methylobacterium TaxID=2615210 RepID=UPI000152CEC9|nr:MULTISPECIES: NnrU family protein [Methylobacterium]ACA17829.1 NnrUfamily protein [Methylobacterium sp. 4-46]WFT83596.1 NnrU family protein [Methylobacterium nodulans]